MTSQTPSDDANNKLEGFSNIIASELVGDDAKDEDNNVEKAGAQDDHHTQVITNDNKSQNTDSAANSPEESKKDIEDADNSKNEADTIPKPIEDVSAQIDATIVGNQQSDGNNREDNSTNEKQIDNKPDGTEEKMAIEEKPAEKEKEQNEQVEEATQSELPPLEPETQNYQDDDDEDFHIQADYSTKPGDISIDEYDMNKVTKFTDPGTIKALDSLCVDPMELFMLSPQEIAKYDDDPDFRTVFVNHHQDRIYRLKKIVSRERRRILDYEANSGFNKSQMSTMRDASTGGAIEMEQKQLEKLKARQKREVEAMINSLFALDRMQRDMQEAEKLEAERKRKIEEERQKKAEESHERHMQRLKELAELEQQKLKAEEEKRRIQYEKDKKALELQKKLCEEKLQQMKDNEKMRLEKAEQNRKQIQKIEEERKRKIAEADQKIQEREVRRIAKMQEENERLNREHQEIAEKRQKQIQAAREYEIKILEQKRNEAIEREKIQTQKLIESEQHKKEEIERFAKMQEEKIKRNHELRMQILKEQEEYKRSKCSSDADIQRRIENMEKIKEERATAARLSRSDSAVKEMRRNEIYQKKMSLKQQQLEESAKKTQEKIIKAKEEKEKQQRLRSLQFKLKQEETQRNQLRLEKQKQKKNEAVKKKIDNENKRISQMEEERNRIIRDRMMRIKQLQDQKQEVTEHIMQFAVKNKVDYNTIQKLAQRYDIDYKAIKAKYERPKTSIEQTPLPSLTSNT